MDEKELVHDAAHNRYVRHMEPKDAFVSYRMEGDKKILTHIEVHPSFRGTGLGAEFAEQVFERVISEGVEAGITCTYMRHLAGTRPDWAAHFGLA